MDEDMYYDDLENYDHDVGNVLELKAEKASLEELIQEMTNTMQVMSKALSKPSVLVEGLRKWILSFEDDYDDLKKKYDDMSSNFSSLIKTVRAELSRKDRMIADLNTEKDQIIFNKVRTGTYHAPTTQMEDLQLGAKRRNSLIENDVVKKPKSVPMKLNTTATHRREISIHTDGVKNDYSEDLRLIEEKMNASPATGHTGQRTSDKDQEKDEIFLKKLETDTHHSPKTPPEDPQQGTERRNSLNNSAWRATHHRGSSKHTEGVKDDYSENSWIREEKMYTSAATGHKRQRTSDKDQEKTTISTRSRIKSTPEKRYAKFNTRSSKRNPAWASTHHREISKHTEDVNDDYSQELRVREEKMNTSTAKGHKGQRTSDKDQEKTTTSTSSRMKSRPPSTSSLKSTLYAKFNTESSKGKERSQGNDRKICKILRDPHEDSSSYVSKRSRNKNEAHHNKYDKRSDSREIDYRHRVLRSPSNERRSRNFEGTHRTYGRPKSERDRSPSRERVRARSRDSRDRRYRDRLRADPKGRFQHDDYERDEKPSIHLNRETHFSSSGNGCSQDRSATPLKSKENSPVQCLSNDPAIHLKSKENSPVQCLSNDPAIHLKSKENSPVQCLSNDPAIHLKSKENSPVQCLSNDPAIPLKCKQNSPVQCLSNDPVTLVENDPRYGQYRNIKEETDLKIIPLYKDEATGGTNNIKPEWCAESPNSKEWNYESTLVSDLSTDVIKIEKYDDTGDQEMSIKEERQELTLNNLEYISRNEINELSLGPSEIIASEELKKDRRRPTKESKARNVSKCQKEKKKYDQYEITLEKNKSKKTENKYLKELNATPTFDNLQSELPNIECSNNLFNEKVNLPKICGADKMDFKELPNTVTESGSINTQEPDLDANSCHNAPGEGEPNLEQITDVINESDAGIVVQKERSQYNDNDGVVSKNSTLHGHENIHDSKENDIHKANKEETSLDPTVPNAIHKNITETEHNTDLVNDNSSASEGYNVNTLISTSNYMKEDNVLKLEETVKETICSQGNIIIETNDSKENDVAIGNQNEIPKIISESKDNSKQSKLVIRRRKTVVKRKE